MTTSILLGRVALCLVRSFRTRKTTGPSAAVFRLLRSCQLPCQHRRSVRQQQPRMPKSLLLRPAHRDLRNSLGGTRTLIHQSPVIVSACRDVNNPQRSENTKGGLHFHEWCSKDHRVSATISCLDWTVGENAFPARSALYIRLISETTQRIHST